MFPKLPPAVRERDARSVPPLPLATHPRSFLGRRGSASSPPLRQPRPSPPPVDRLAGSVTMMLTISVCLAVCSALAFGLAAPPKRLGGIEAWFGAPGRVGWHEGGVEAAGWLLLAAAVLGLVTYVLRALRATRLSPPR